MVRGAIEDALPGSGRGVTRDRHDDLPISIESRPFFSCVRREHDPRTPQAQLEHDPSMPRKGFHTQMHLWWFCPRPAAIAVPIRPATYPPPTTDPGRRRGCLAAHRTPGTATVARPRPACGLRARPAQPARWLAEASHARGRSGTESSSPTDGKAAHAERKEHVAARRDGIFGRWVVAHRQ